MTEIATNCEGLWCISLISLRYRFLKKAYLSGCLNNRKRLSVRECASVRERVCVGCHACVGVEESVWARASAFACVQTCWRVWVWKSVCVCESSCACTCKRERESERVSKKRLWSVWIDESKNLRMSVFYLKLQLFGEEQNRKKSRAAKFCENKKKQEKQKEQQQ